MAQPLRIRIAGEPVTWKRPVWRTTHVYNPNSHHQQNIREDIRGQLEDVILEGPLRVELTFWFKRPETHFERGFVRRDDAPGWYTNKVDIDNLSKNVMDAMSGLVYKDDHQIVWLTSSKRYSDLSVGYTEVTVWTV